MITAAVKSSDRETFPAPSSCTLGHGVAGKTKLFSSNLRPTQYRVVKLRIVKEEMDATARVSVASCRDSQWKGSETSHLFCSWTRREGCARERYRSASEVATNLRIKASRAAISAFEPSARNA
jgi:hypothetical protein